MYQPEWKGPLEGYATNYISAQMWRMPRHMEFSDLMQEAYVVYLRCVARYQVEEAKHFMALFKRALCTEITDLSVKATKQRQEVLSCAADDEHTDFAPEALPGDMDNNGALLVAIRQMPREVSTIVALFLSAPQELLDLASAAWNSRQRGSQPRAGSTKHINRLLGLPESSDPIGTVERYFRPD